MTKDEALDLALEALEKLRTPLRVNTSLDAYDVGRAITAIKQARSAPVQPVAFEEWLAKQHGDPEEIGFLQALRIAYIAGQDSITTPPAAQPASVQPVASLKEVDVLMMAEAHGIDPCTKGLYGFYIDCISNQHAAQPAPVQEPVLEVVNGQINRSWDAIPAGFTGMLYMQSQSNVPPKKPKEPWYGSARVDDYNRGWNDCVDSIDTAPQTAHIPQPWGTYMGHRMTPAGTKEFWGFADAPIPEGTKLYTTPPAQPAPAPEGRDWSLLEATQESLREHMAEIKRLKEAQPAPVQSAERGEPVAVIGSAFQLLYCREDWAKGLKVGDTLCLCTPPAAQRQWVGLTDEELFCIYNKNDWNINEEWNYERAIEAKLKEKNNG